MKGTKSILFLRYMLARVHLTNVSRTRIARCCYSSINNRINKELYFRPNILQYRKPVTYCTSRYSTVSENKTTKETVDISNNDQSSKNKSSSQLAKVFAAYGTTGMVFHTALSLTSLGMTYTAVSSGIDVVGLLQKVGIMGEMTTSAKVAGGATTFVIAYACHKVFMPVRIFITVTCTPLIVRKLRQMGMLKEPVKPK